LADLTEYCPYFGCSYDSYDEGFPILTIRKQGQAMKHGMPEDSGNAFGYEVRRLRTRRGLTQGMLVDRLVDILNESAKKYLYISEGWLEGIEQSREIKLRRAVIEALCEALSRTLSEKDSLLLLADRNVLVIAEETPDQFGEFENNSKSWFHREAKEIVNTIPDVQAQKLTSDENEIIFGTALELVKKDHRNQG
jgi:transcriptional regulator with XRE-family HTH domain